MLYGIWYMVSSFREPINHYLYDLKIMFELGADANIRNQNGLNLLHVLGFTQNGEAIDPVIIERLVAHVANLSDVDIRGNTRSTKWRSTCVRFRLCGLYFAVAPA